MTIQQPIMRTSSDLEWWRGAVIYQVYPRSFQDSTGNGIGDLAGITQRLPYIKSLGVDAIWISPFFKSPMKDFGYDVSDYCEIDPMFGTLGDFDAMVDKAHKLGLKIMVDLVLSHSSDEHAWFAESRLSRENQKANWYVWSDPKPDGTAPNNWLSIFGGSAWTWDPRREQYYLHNFLSTQPDLNFHEPEVQTALLDVARFWLDRGVDGFRLDTINFYFADQQLRDNPPLAKEKRNDTIAPSVNPYNHQEHIYSKNRPENLAFLAKLRALLDSYQGRTSVGEVGDAQRGLEIMGQYTAGTTGVHMCYAFEFLEKTKLTAARVKEVMDHVDEVAKDGWACWAYSNHDVMRHATRWNLSTKAAKIYTTLLMSLRGSACIYQGEELGLPEAVLNFEDLQDPYGVEFWPEFKGRDGCRTPMTWHDENANAGFSVAKPWLPISSEHLIRSVEAQEKDLTSMLAHYRRAVALRARFSALRYGDQRDIQVYDDVISFIRSTINETLFCAFNLSENMTEVTLPEGRWRKIGAEIDGAQVVGKKAQLEPWQPVFAIREG